MNNNCEEAWMEKGKREEGAKVEMSYVSFCCCCDCVDVSYTAPGGIFLLFETIL